MRIKSIKLNGKQLLPTEHDEQVAFFQMLALEANKDPRLNWIFAIGNGGKRHIVTAMKMKAEGVKPGVFDIFVPIPVGKIPGMFIEMKRRDGKLSKAQLDFARHIIIQGYAIAIAYSAEEAMAKLRVYLTQNSC